MGQSWRVYCLDEEELGGRLRVGPVEEAWHEVPPGQERGAECRTRHLVEQALLTTVTVRKV